MYCEKCGQEILDEAVVCVKCGCPTMNYKKKIESHTTLAIIQNKSSNVVDYDKANRIIIESTKKIKICGYISLIELMPLLAYFGVLFGLVDDYVPFFFIIPVFALIVIFALDFNLLSNINKVNVENAIQQEKLKKLKKQCIFQPFAGVVTLLFLAIVLFIQTH